MNQQRTTDWSLIYTEWKPKQQPLREALCALGNGYFVTRGAAEEASAGGHHYPGTYLAGGYNRLESEIKGHVLENEDLVNWPNWLCLTFRPEGGNWFRPDEVKILDYHKEFKVNEGLLLRNIRFQDPEEREFELRSQRLVHMANPHLAAIHWQLTALNWDGTIEICSALDGSVENVGVERYRDLNGQHLTLLDNGQVDEDAIYLTVETKQSHIRMSQAARTRIDQDDGTVVRKRETREQEGKIAQHLFVECQRHKPVRLEKVVAIHTSRDPAISSPTLAACKLVRRADDFEKLSRTHTQAWNRIWDRADIQLEDGDTKAQLILRLHIAHLAQTTSIHTIDRDVGVPSRGWHGEAYRGHILWDEIFIFPFLTLRIPELTRTLLMYRYRRLAEARHLAREAGHRGAMFPWQSGSDGTEESQELHLNPRSGRWVPDNSNIQRHVNAAIAFNVWQYFQATDDMEFMSFYGAEILLEIARFWASITTYNAERDRFEIHGVMGPDEFHTHYPDSDEPGLKNNAYTNVMAVWSLRTAQKILDMLAEFRRNELLEDLQLDEEELARWTEIGSKMFIPMHDEGIISQFEGYEQLKEFDWQGYRKKYDNIQRLDRILEAEDDDVNRYQAAKQADVLMLFYLFSTRELAELFQALRYDLNEELIHNNIDYYLHRTSHGSTLSNVVHSWVLARHDRPKAWALFQKALRSDVEDIQGGTTSEGIHLGAMAGTVDLIQRGITGIELCDGVLWFDTKLPDELDKLQLRVRYRGHWLKVELTQRELNVHFEKGWSDGVRIGLGDEVHEMKQGDQRNFSL